MATTLILLAPSYADSSQNSKQAQIEEKISKALSNMAKTAVDGPKSIPLVDQATLSLGEGYTFIPKEEAHEYMEAHGNINGPDLIGMVVSHEGDLNWIILIKYIDEGYVKEDDAKNWNADELFKSLQEGAEIANKERKKQGYPTFHITGWIEKPTYDSNQHKLIWSIEGEDDVDSLLVGQQVEKFVNYSTYALGRHGYFQLNLLTSKDNVDADKVHAAALLQAIHFNEGKRYEDFVEGHDKVAEYGLGALILGVAAKKLGLFAMAGVFLAKMWKLIAVGFIVLGSFIRKLFSRKKGS